MSSRLNFLDLYSQAETHYMVSPANLLGRLISTNSSVSLPNSVGAPDNSAFILSNSSLAFLRLSSASFFACSSSFAFFAALSSPSASSPSEAELEEQLELSDAEPEPARFALGLRLLFDLGTSGMNSVSDSSDERLAVARVDI